MTALSPTAAALSRPVPWLAIVGIGEDGRSGLSPAAAATLDAAEIVFGGERHLALAAPIAAEAIAWPKPFAAAYAEVLARRGRRVCVLASGDPFTYGVGAEFARHVAADEMVCLPQASSFSLAAARLGWSVPDCTCVSLHGRALERIVPHLQPGARLLVLSWDDATPAKVAGLLAERGFGTSQVIVLEAMGGPRERLRRAPAAAFDIVAIEPLNLVAVEVAAGHAARIVTLAPGLDDALYETDGLLTKAEVRAVTLSALAPRVGEMLWDIGAGTGSIGIEWMLLHERNRAVAIEANPLRAARIRRNANDLGVPDLAIVEGRAPAALAGLPVPDAVFIGGGIGDPAIVEAAFAALPAGGRLVANAVTLESEEILAACFRRYGGTMRRIAISRLEAVGGLHGFRPAMPVTQWRVARP